MIDYLSTFIFFFAVIDPVGTLPVFLAVTSQYSALERRLIAVKATLIALGVLLFFIVAGEHILSAIDIPLAAFQIAGGLVLLLFALSMIFGESKPEEELKMVRSHTETAVFPLAVPSIASPGAMLAAVLLTENARHPWMEQVQTAVVMSSVLLVAFLLMLLANPIQKWIGSAGASIVSRVMGLILSSVAVTNMLEGIKTYFEL